MLGAIKSYGNCEVKNSHHKVIISDNMAILLSLFTHFDLDPVFITLYSELLHQFLFVTLTLNVFLRSFTGIDQGD